VRRSQNFPNGSDYQPKQQQGAIPEPRMVKQSILHARDDAAHFREVFTSTYVLESFVNFRSAVISLYQEIQSFTDNLSSDELELKTSDLELDDDKDPIDYLRHPGAPPQEFEDVTEDKIKLWERLFYALDDILVDIGPRDIMMKKKGSSFGNELVNQFDIDVKKENLELNLDVEDADIGFIRLLIEFQNIRKAMRSDKDVVGVVVSDGEGSANRLGKTTLALILARLVENGENQGTLPDKALVFNDDDFWDGMVDLPKYSAIEIDELSGIFYAKDAMKGEQKERKKRMKTAAKKNQFVIGCDTNFFNIDREFRSDKIDFVLVVPQRGRFELYGPEEIQEFEEGENGELERPDPLFSGNFPDLNPGDWDPEEGDPEEPENPIEEYGVDPVWVQYNAVEDKKLTRNQEDAAEQLDLHEIKGEIKKRKDYFVTEYKGREFVDKDLVQMEWQDLTEKQSKQVKKAAEKDLGLNQDDGE